MEVMIHDHGSFIHVYCVSIQLPGQPNYFQRVTLIESVIERLKQLFD